MSHTVTYTAWFAQVQALHLATLRDHDVLHGLSLWVCDGPRVLDLGDNVHTFNDVTENNVLAVQMGCSMFCCDDEELAAIRLYLVSTAISVLLVQLTFGPLLAMESSPGLSCFNSKFSSANFSVP